jgi:hypothetical protein
MAKKKKTKKTAEPKTRNWLALHAKGLTGRKGAGAHNQRGYNRTAEKKKMLKEMR